VHLEARLSTRKDAAFLRVAYRSVKDWGIIHSSYWGSFLNFKLLNDIKPKTEKEKIYGPFNKDYPCINVVSFLNF
jgi:hypothetical protein